MAMSPQFALSSPHDDELSKASRSFVYSFDLHGNLIEMSAAFARTTGYNRAETAQLNFSQLLDQESWQRSRDQTLVLLGGGESQPLEFTAVSKHGQRVRMEVMRHLLFDRGRPVAIQDTGRWLDPVPEAPLQPATDTDRFAEQLRQLHRLSTTRYATLEEALAITYAPVANCSTCHRDGFCKWTETRGWFRLPTGPLNFIRVSFFCCPKHLPTPSKAGSGPWRFRSRQRSAANQRPHSRPILVRQYGSGRSCLQH